MKCVVCQRIIASASSVYYKGIACYECYEKQKEMVAAFMVPEKCDRCGSRHLNGFASAEKVKFTCANCGNVWEDDVEVE